MKGVFRESFEFLGKNKKYIYIAAGIFLFGSIFGFLFSSQLGFFDDLLKELAGKVEGLNTGELIWFIFQNNLKSAFFTLIFGVFIGIFPVINAMTNGVLLGYVFSKASAIDGWTSIWKLFPHGIFELPAVFIAIGLGMAVGFGFINNYFAIYRKKLRMKVFGVLSVVLGFLGLAFLFSPISSSLGDSVISTIIYNIVMVLIGLAMILPFIVLFFFSDKKLKVIQKKSFFDKFYSSLKVFFYIILPLLIVAAVIEGLLIAYYT